MLLYWECSCRRSQSWLVSAAWLELALQSVHAFCNHLLHFKTHAFAACASSDTRKRWVEECLETHSPIMTLNYWISPWFPYPHWDISLRQSYAHESSPHLHQGARWKPLCGMECGKPESAWFLLVALSPRRHGKPCSSQAGYRRVVRRRWDVAGSTQKFILPFVILEIASIPFPRRKRRTTWKAIVSSFLF